MQISVTFRQLEPSEALKQYVSDRLNRMKRYLEGPTDAHVVLGLAKFRHLADVTIESNGRVIKGREENTDMYAAIDLVMDKIDMQLKKVREKLREKGDRSRIPAVAMAPEHTATTPSIRRKQVEVPPLELADALELVSTGKDPVIVFTDVASGGLSVLVKRSDGSFLLVEPTIR